MNQLLDCFWNLHPSFGKNLHDEVPKRKYRSLQRTSSYPTLGKRKKHPNNNPPGFLGVGSFGHYYRVAVMKMQRTHPSTVRKYGNSLHPSHSPVKRGEFHGFFERQKGPPNKQRLPKKQPFGAGEAWTVDKKVAVLSIDVQGFSVSSWWV